ncbi:branched-chain amino acid ABC transporter permease [candidate division KSB3 bacterium]|uniref:Branched-chain amino acid ABC transporter permease n=1 Tax=candidate division KSB3 bacterium TaxID=2044937 RepID=A0A2G6E8Z9_9BACT|nr:MAG: branched-chain amino acid ABC transporter permease [candidate division KSB3 bacterium]
MGTHEGKHVSVAEEFSAKIHEERRKARIIDLAPLGILVLMTVLMSIFIEGFFTVSNAINIFNQIASPLVLAVGLTFVIVLGSIDLSVEGVMGFTGSIVTLLVLNNKTPYDLGVWGILLSVLAGTLVGTITGLLHVKLRIPSFMVTFGVASIITGAGILSYRGRPASVLDPMFVDLSQGTLLGIPYLTCFALLVCLAGYLIQEYTAFGRHVFAIGENESIVRSTGIPVDRIKIIVFTWCAFCASIAGIFGAVRLKRGEVIIGYGFLFYTITAVVVGGTSLSGGKGGVLQSLVGVFIVTVIQSSLILLGVNPYIQSAIQGIIIILAVALTVARGKKFIIK